MIAICKAAYHPRCRQADAGECEFEIVIECLRHVRN